MTPAITDVLAPLLLTAMFLGLGRTYSTTGYFAKILRFQRTSSRYLSIDGLRAFLALGVFFGHAKVVQTFYITGRWELPTPPLFAVMAESSVALFFMITAFLFWGKALDQSVPISPTPFYRSRWRRLAPMFFVSVALVFVTVFARTGFALSVPWAQLVVQMARWLPFGLLGTPDINGYAGTQSIESVHWTLAFEWFFYLSVPFFSRLRRGTIALLVFWSLYGLFSPLPLARTTLCFSLGAFAAWLARTIDLPLVFKSRLWDGVLLGLSILIFLVFDRGHGVRQYALLFLCFLLLVAGNDLFGLFTSLPARFLGLLTYSFYLLHNILLNYLFRWANRWRPMPQISPVWFWSLTVLGGCLTILVSAWTVRFVENRFYSAYPRGSSEQNQKPLSPVAHSNRVEPREVFP